MGNSKNDTGMKCPECGNKLIWKRGKHGEFIGCAGFPHCRYIHKATGKGRLELQADEILARAGRKDLIL